MQQGWSEKGRSKSLSSPLGSTKPSRLAQLSRVFSTALHVCEPAVNSAPSQHHSPPLASLLLLTCQFPWTSPVLTPSTHCPYHHQPQRSRLPLSNMPSILSDDDKQVVKRTVPKPSNKIHAVAVARLYIAYPNRSRWTYTGLQGAAVLAEDRVGNTFWIKLVDISVRFQSEYAFMRRY
jgi:WH1 domain